MSLTSDQIRTLVQTAVDHRAPGIPNPPEGGEGRKWKDCFIKTVVKYFETDDDSLFLDSAEDIGEEYKQYALARMDLLASLAMKNKGV